MLAPRIIPVLLLDGRRLVKTTRFGDARYVGDPINAVRIFNQKEVDELILLDITATAQGRGPQFDFIREIASEAFMPVCYGGGLTTLGQLEKLFALGIEKISLGTAGEKLPGLIGEAAATFGSQSVVACVDFKRRLLGGPTAATRRGQHDLKRKPADYGRAAQEAGAGEILLQSVDRDGMMNGYDLPVVADVAKAISVPLIACGGAGSLKDVAAALAHGASAAAAGSLFVFHGKLRAVLISYPSREELLALAAHRGAHP
ncbi:MAG TPA: AglZ/HisF2 family acetamidino modification protein [Opitutaceae bacterium]|nr:AglZ/HisF2 family acetamidino modification protein [Opitutaceae bacterium]